MITLGILLAYVAGFELSTVSGNCRWMLGLGAIPGAILAISMIFVPHTPRWLVSVGRNEEDHLVERGAGRAGAYLPLQRVRQERRLVRPGVGLLATVFIWLRVPETRGKSLEQIEDEVGARPQQENGAQPGRAA